MYKYVTISIVILVFSLLIGCQKENSIYSPEHSQFKLYINEIGYNPNWIEIYNDEDTAIDLRGFLLYADYKNKVRLSSNVIPSKGYIVYNLASIQGNNNLPVFINKNGGVVYLEDPYKKLVDKFEFVNLVDGGSYGRLPDGGNNYIYFDTPTPMQSNYTFMMPNQPPVIKDVSFSPINPMPFQEVAVSAFIFDDHGLTSAKLIYYDDINNVEYKADFTNTCCDPRKLEAKIQGFPANYKISFYITATDDSSAVSFYPDGAPAVKISYEVGNK